MTTLGRFGAFRSAVELELALYAEGPILIRGPDAFVADAPDMAFIRIPTPHGEVPYLPGSSLKGILRTGAETLLRGLGEEVCDPTSRRGGCGQCQVCRTFGSSNLGAAVLLVGDGMPWPPQANDAARSEILRQLQRRRGLRTGVAIDRRRGSVSAGPFDMEVLADITFHPVLTFRNPEPTQLHLVAVSLDLVDQGLSRIGSGTTKGLGRVRVEATGLRVRCLDPEIADSVLAGLRTLRERQGVFWCFVCEDPNAAWRRWAEAFQAGR